MSRTAGMIPASVRHLALALLVLLACPATAFAHATLLSATPAADSVSAQAPDRIELDFNEPVEMLGLRLIDAAGCERAPETALQGSDGRVVWALPQPLAEGRYLLSWRAASLDGHVIGGSFAFGIGSAGATPAVMASTVPQAKDHRDWLFMSLHAATRLLALFAIGTALFHLVLDRRDADRWLERTTRRLSIGGLIASLLYVAAEGTMRAGLSPAGMLSFGCWEAAFTASNIGWRGLGMVGLVLLAAGRDRKSQGLGIACAVAAMADSGHVLSVLPKGIGHGLMILHGLAAAMWMGAIAPLRRALARDGGTATALLFRRFQIYGGLAMGATLASGLLLTWFLLPDLSDLWRSDYGLRLSAKLAAVGLMVLIAAGNRLCLTRRAFAGRARMRSLLRAILAFDVVAASMATMLAVGLSLGAPPAGSLDVAIAGKAYEGTLSFAPGKAGDNDLRIALRPETGVPADPQEVEVRLTVPGLEPILRKAKRVGPGRYAIDKLPLWQPGPWNVEVGVLVDDFTKLELSAPVTLSR